MFIRKTYNYAILAIASYNLFKYQEGVIMNMQEPKT